MNFSDSIPGKGQIAPNGELLAVVEGLSLCVYDTLELDKVARWQVLDQVTQLVWGTDSSIIMCAQAKRAVVQLFNAVDPVWQAKVDLGLAGLSGAWLCPDSRQLLTVSEFQVRLNIWSLLDRSVSYIKGPKFSRKGLGFSSDAKFMALIEANEGTDNVGVYDTKSWELASYFEVDTHNAEDLKWNPDNTAILVWDNPVNYKLLVYSPSGELLNKFSAYENALGIQSVELSPSGSYIAVGSYDKKVRVLHHITWQKLSEWSHDKEIQNGKDIHIYQEEEYRESRDKLSSQYVLASLPVTFKSLGSNKPKGISHLQFSHDGRYLASVSEELPNVLWIWDNVEMGIRSVLVHKHSVKSLGWSPKHTLLATATGNSNLYLWSEEGSSVCDMPFEDFCAFSVEWSSDGQSLLVEYKNNFVVAYPQLEDLLHYQSQ